jgi:toxin ParE1/3/4
MRPVWSGLASSDLLELLSYIANDSPQNAELVRKRILKTVELLGEMPHAGRPGRIAGTRERVAGRTPFILVYRVEPEQIVILRVYRGSRKSPGSLSM